MYKKDSEPKKEQIKACLKARYKENADGKINKSKAYYKINSEPKKLLPAVGIVKQRFSQCK